MNPAGWPGLKDRLTALFLTKTRDEWCALMDGTDICFAPVLSLTEAPQHPHNVARGDFRGGGRHGPARARAALLGHACAAGQPRRTVNCCSPASIRWCGCWWSR